MKKYLLIILLLLAVKGMAQNPSPYFKILPTDVSATYAVFHVAILTDSVHPYMFFYWIDPNHQKPFMKYHYDTNSDSLITSDTVFGLQCNQKYFVQVMGFGPGTFGGAVGTYDTFYTPDTIGCTAGINNNLATHEKIQIIPNPVTLVSSIIMPPAFSGWFYVYDLVGRMVKRIEVTKGKGSVSNNDLQRGIYCYRVEVANKIYSGKLVIQ